MRSRHTQKHTEETGGGGLEPAAANPGYWDQVPYSETIRPMPDQCVPGCQAAVEAAAHSSTLCAKNRPSEPRLSRLKRQRSPIAEVIDLRREIQTVNARKPNGRSAQTARQGRMGARAGSPGAIGRPGRRRQTSAHRNQTSGIMCQSADAGASARAPAFDQPKRVDLSGLCLVDRVYDPEHRFSVYAVDAGLPSRLSLRSTVVDRESTR